MKKYLSEEQILELMGADINFLKMWVATVMTDSERDYWRELRDKYNEYTKARDVIKVMEYRFIIRGFKLNMWQKYKSHCPNEMIDGLPKPRELSWEEIG